MDEQADQFHLLEQASAEFEDGLRNCQALVEDFRSKLASNGNQAWAHNSEAFESDCLVG